MLDWNFVILEVDVYEDDKYYSSTALHSRNTFFFKYPFTFCFVMYYVCVGNCATTDIDTSRLT